MFKSRSETAKTNVADLIAMQNEALTSITAEQVKNVSSDSTLNTIANSIETIQQQIKIINDKRTKSKDEKKLLAKQNKLLDTFWDLQETQMMYWVNQVDKSLNRNPNLTITDMMGLVTYTHSITEFTNTTAFSEISNQNSSKDFTHGPRFIRRKAWSLYKKIQRQLKDKIKNFDTNKTDSDNSRAAQKLIKQIKKLDNAVRGNKDIEHLVDLDSFQQSITEMISPLSDFIKQAGFQKAKIHKPGTIRHQFLASHRKTSFEEAEPSAEEEFFRKISLTGGNIKSRKSMQSVLKKWMKENKLQVKRKDVTNKFTDGKNFSSTISLNKGNDEITIVVRNGSDIDINAIFSDSDAKLNTAIDSLVQKLANEFNAQPKYPSSNLGMK